MLCTGARKVRGGEGGTGVASNLGVSSVQMLRCWGIRYQRPLTWGASSAWVLRRCVASFAWVLRCWGLRCQRIEDAVSDLGSDCQMGPGALGVRIMEVFDLGSGE